VAVRPCAALSWFVAMEAGAGERRGANHKPACTAAT
jgi:hypothetical protein